MRKMTHAIFEEFWASNDGQALNHNPASRDDQLPNIVIQHREQFKRLGDLLGPTKNLHPFLAKAQEVV